MIRFDKNYKVQDSWFINKYGMTRAKWEETIMWPNYINEIYKKKGITNRKFEGEEKHIRATKGHGSSDIEKHGGEDIIKRKKRKGNPRFDIEKIFDFNYNDMMNSKCDTNNDLLHIIFNHKFYKKELDKKYKEYKNRYENMLITGEIHKVNEIFQKFSTYIHNNHLKTKWVDGSIIVNISFMIDEYVRNNIIHTDIDYYDLLKKEEYEMNEDAKFYLFLLKQCFTSRNKYYKKFICGQYIHDWWAICHLQCRHSRLDMKPKGECSIKNENGKNIFLLYFIDDSEQEMD
jgi:hypothetical protein